MYISLNILYKAENSGENKEYWNIDLFDWKNFVTEFRVIGQAKKYFHVPMSGVPIVKFKNENANNEKMMVYEGIHIGWKDENNALFLRCSFEKLMEILHGKVIENVKEEFDDSPEYTLKNTEIMKFLNKYMVSLIIRIFFLVLVIKRNFFWFIIDFMDHHKSIDIVLLSLIFSQYFLYSFSGSRVIFAEQFHMSLGVILENFHNCKLGVYGLFFYSDKDILSGCYGFVMPGKHIYLNLSLFGFYKNYFFAFCKYTYDIHRSYLRGYLAFNLLWFLEIDDRKLQVFGLLNLSNRNKYKFAIIIIIFYISIQVGLQKNRGSITPFLCIGLLAYVDTFKMFYEKEKNQLLSF